MRPNEKEKIFKDITEMVKENDFSTAKNALEVKTIKKLSPRDISEILFHLLPLKTRSSKEISALLLEYNRPDLLATDEKGISLLKNMLEHGRADLLNSVVKKSGNVTSVIFSYNLIGEKLYDIFWNIIRNRLLRNC